jgi:hypothetical protein
MRGTRTEFSDKPIQHDRVDDPRQTAAADDDPDSGTSPSEEPVSRNSCCRGVEDGSGDTKGGVSEDELVVFVADYRRSRRPSYIGIRGTYKRWR